MPAEDIPRDESIEGVESSLVPHPSSPAPRLTRRRFLALGGALVATGILAACMEDDEDEEDEETVNDRDGTPTLVGATRTPDSAIETPQIGASPTGSADGTPVAAGDADLEQFMAVSRALTGFDELDDTELGQVYLDSITSDDDLGDQLQTLYDKAGLAEGASDVTLDDLEEAGAFDGDTLQVANTITTYWYTGRYDTGDDETVVATYINALAWQATGYRMTGPSTCSGQVGNWTVAPAA